MNRFLLYFLIFTSAQAAAFTAADDSASFYHRKGMDAFDRYDFEEAARLFEREGAKLSGASAAEKEGLEWMLGRTYRQLGKYNLAQQKLWSAFVTSKKLRGELSDVYLQRAGELALLFIDAGKYVAAERVMQKNLALTQKLKGRQSAEAAAVMDGLGRISTMKSEFDRAEEFHTTASGMYEAGGKQLSPLYADHLAAQSLLYLRQGSYTASEALLRQADFIYAKSLPVRAPARLELLMLRAELLIELRNYAGAAEMLELYTSHLRHNAGIQNPRLAWAHTCLADVYIRTGYYRQAESMLRDAVAVFDKTLGRQHIYALTARALAGVLAMHTGDYGRADSLLEHTSEAISLLMGENSFEYAESLLRKADLYYRTGRYADAIAMHEHSLVIKKELLDINHPHYMKSYKDLSLLRWAQQRPSAADRNFIKSCNNYINQFHRYFAFLSEKEKGYFYNDIRSYFDKFNAFVLAHYQKDHLLTGDMYDFHLATKGLLFHSSHEVRQRIADSGDKQLAEKYQRWISVKEHLAKLYKLDRKEIDEQGIPLDSLEDMANFLEKELSLRVELSQKEEPAAGGLLAWQQIKNALAPDEAAVEIVRVPSFVPDSGGRYREKIYYAALVITSRTDKKPALILHDKGAEMENKFIKFYKNAIRMKIEDRVSYVNFWSFIAQDPAMAGIKKLYFSADGVYNQLNVNTFFNEATGKYVIEELDIHFLTNTKDVLQIKKPVGAAAAGTAEVPVLLGYPKYYALADHAHAADESHHLRTRGGVNELFRGGVIRELPGTQKEIQSISSIFDSAHRAYSMHLALEADENRVKSLHSPVILHIATHGFFMEDKSFVDDAALPADTGTVKFENLNDNPLMRSGIMLVGAGDAYSDETLQKEIEAVMHGSKHEDGILTAYEALNLDLDNTDLVVLSACETGLGVVKNGEGVYGLQRALQTAGAKAIIMSLWKVNDATTQELMTEFYEQWLATGDKRAAFRSAQSRLRVHYPDPMYWGAFVMIGE